MMPRRYAEVIGFESLSFNENVKCSWTCVLFPLSKILRSRSSLGTLLSFSYRRKLVDLSIL
jgi:hypothetical protein